MILPISRINANMALLSLGIMTICKLKLAQKILQINIVPTVVISIMVIGI